MSLVEAIVEGVGQLTGAAGQVVSSQGQGTEECGARPTCLWTKSCKERKAAFNKCIQTQQQIEMQQVQSQNNLAQAQMNQKSSGSGTSTNTIIIIAAIALVVIIAMILILKK